MDLFAEMGFDGSITAVTDNEMDDDKREFLCSSADAVVTKPIKKDNFEMILICLQQNQHDRCEDLSARQRIQILNNVFR